MTRLRELLSDKPLLAAYVAVAVTAMTTAPLAYDKFDRMSRMMDGELVTVAQAVSLDAHADEAMRDIARFAVGLQSAQQIEDSVAFREKMQEISNELHSVHFSRIGGKSPRTPDPLAVYADQLQAKGVHLQDAIWMLESWEKAAADGNVVEAARRRGKVLDIVLGTEVDVAGLDSRDFDESRLASHWFANP